MTLDISVIMPVCAWPNPSDMTGAPHPELLNALDSVVNAMAPMEGARAPSVEVIVGVDGPALVVAAAVRDWAAKHPEVTVRVEMFEKSVESTFGNRQRNRILDAGCAGRLIVWQDQDDRFYRNALTGVVAVAEQHEGLPLIFRMTAYHHTPPAVFGTQKGLIQHAAIGGHMLVTPNEPQLLARWEPETEYAADFNFIRATLDNFEREGRHAFWSSAFISMLRPWVKGIPL